MKDKMPYEVIHLLSEAGWSLRQLAYAHGYRSATSLHRALRESAPKAEQLIADTLKLNRKDIWPSRTGQPGVLGRKPKRPALVAA